MKILITGGAGYIGTKLAAHLSTKHEVTVIDNFMYRQGVLAYPALKECNVLRTDIVSIKGYAKLLDSVLDSDVIIPLAAIVGAPACDKNPDVARSINLDSIRSLISNVSKGLPKPTIIFPNTNSGYGKAKDTICTEETPLNPISLYGNLKDTAEAKVREYDNHIVFRLATVFGWSYRPRIDLLVNTLVYEAVKHRKIQLFDDAFMRNYIHIDDIVSAFDFAIDNRHKMHGNVYNLGNDALNMTKGDLVRTIQEIIPNVDVELINKSDPDQRDYVVSSQKLYNIGWKPLRDLDYGIRELKQYYSIMDDSFLEYMKNV